MKQTFATSAGLSALAFAAIQTTAWAQSAPTAAEDRILVQAWAQAETIISSPMAGQLTDIPTRVGTSFRKGQTLIRFNCTESEARAEIAQSELTGATEAMDAKIRLKAMNAASEIEVTTAAAQVAKAQAQLKLSRYQASQCTIAAPYSGYVVRTLGKPYQTTTVGQPLVEIISAGTPKLKLSANSRLFTRLKVGTDLRVTIDETGATYDAEVTLINARIDPVNQSFELEAKVKGNAKDLLPGMSGTAVLAPAAAADNAQKKAK